MTDAEGLDDLAMRQVVPGYIGFDVTAPSLHVGNLVAGDAAPARAAGPATSRSW